MNFEIAIIKWTDSTYYKLDYCSPEEELDIPRPKTLFSIGMFIYEDEDCIVIAQDFEPTSKASRMVLSIPKVSIIKYEIKKINVKSFDTEKITQSE